MRCIGTTSSMKKGLVDADLGSHPIPADNEILKYLSFLSSTAYLTVMFSNIHLLHLRSYRLMRDQNTRLSIFETLHTLLYLFTQCIYCK